MTSVPKCRYALWYHGTQVLGSQVVQWRETPKSKALVAVAPPTVLPGAVEVVSAKHDHIAIRITAEQARAIGHWLTDLPSDVLHASACETHIIDHNGTYGCFDASMSFTDKLPRPGDHVLARVTVNVSRIGPMRKANIVVVDVLRADVAASTDES